ncbi:T-lymphocyte activation antigen CD86-like [Strongylocentrotus purpuratus]|uniref:Ig-like domain-containing protein n=1 Tax=Strongylocentrotus purpuratus TaxID=7668 RepID=A0A7M7NEG6_STRPU|nr:T-lymphocyte activation antigen CD86-like [Strongylocentrotus purpuratus]
MIFDMTFSRAFPAIVLVTLLSLTISGTSLEVSITRGGTARIPCPFGEGTPEATPQNIFWYYSAESGSQEILTLFEGNVTIDVAYADSAALEEDNSTLSLKKLTVKDEGTYRCDVGTERQTPVYQTNNTLKVYGLAPNTSPAILQCSQRPLNSSTCMLTGHGPTNLTCELPNVYPKTNFSLGWYHEGRGPLGSPLSITEAREDGTFDLRTNIEVSETGTWTCKASYLSVEGKEETTSSISFSLQDKLGNNSHFVRNSQGFASGTHRI